MSRYAFDAQNRLPPVTRLKSHVAVQPEKPEEFNTGLDAFFENMHTCPHVDFSTGATALFTQEESLLLGSIIMKRHINMGMNEESIS